MIREEDIREFHEIIGRGRYDSESDQSRSGGEQEEEAEEDELSLDENFLDSRENIDDEEETVDKPVSGNTVIFYITTTFGLLFVLSVIIGFLAFLYIGKGNKKGHSNRKNGTNTGKDRWRPPGHKYLVTDPRPSDVNLRVWAIRTAIPPKPYLHLYLSMMRPGEYKAETEEEDPTLEL